MKFNLIICTYNRRASLERLLESVKEQDLYPNEILVIDSSSDEATRRLFQEKTYPSIKYFKVGKEDSGLTRQRNFGIGKTGEDIELLCFLDDDIILEPDYFEKLISTYLEFPDAIAVGGWINDKTDWKIVSDDYVPSFDEFMIDGFVRKLGRRNVLRKKLGLLSNVPPGVMPEFSHGFSIGFLPPSEKTYEVEYFMGGVSSYRKELFDKIQFSSYFEGYGLYEDMDFCLRASKTGKLYVNTAARVFHRHEQYGRPNPYNYGKMVIENGHYVWKVKYPKPTISSNFKHFTIDVILLSLRFLNGLGKDKAGIQDARGRILGLLKVLVNSK